jgi:aminoglycoside phosphotransferase (APT) family kinase protein
VLRRPPLGTLLATAHDVAREYRIVAALAPTAVPVPPPLAVCEDSAVNGTPFAVTGFVDGVVLDTAAKAAEIDEERRRALAYHLIDVLADLHAVDLDAVGLEDLARQDSYIERQLRRWTKQWEGSKTRELATIDQIAAKLAQDIPEQRGATIVHGDYRFGNCISDVEHGLIAAVLDWELCTLGDPMADLGHLCVYWNDPARPLALANDPTSGGGFPSYDELLQRYASRTGRDVSRIEYYRAFAAWRLAIIGEGVAARHLAHHPDDTAALAASQAGVASLAASARASLW